LSSLASHAGASCRDATDLLLELQQLLLLLLPLCTSSSGGGGG
jgi:hypothetical protein